MKEEWRTVPNWDLYEKGYRWEYIDAKHNSE